MEGCCKDKDHNPWKKTAVNIDGQVIENVKSFIYLGSEFIYVYIFGLLLG